MSDEIRAVIEQYDPSLTVSRGIGTVTVHGEAENENYRQRACEIGEKLRAEGFDVPDLAVDHGPEEGIEFFIGTCRTTTVQGGSA